MSSICLTQSYATNCSKSSRRPVTTKFVVFFLLPFLEAADENSERSSVKDAIKACVLPVIIPSCLLTRSCSLTNKARLTFFGTEGEAMFLLGRETRHRSFKFLWLGSRPISLMNTWIPYFDRSSLDDLKHFHTCNSVCACVCARTDWWIKALLEILIFCLDDGALIWIHIDPLIQYLRFCFWSSLNGSWFFRWKAKLFTTYVKEKI